MFQRHLHRHDDVNLVMSALRSDPQCLPTLIEWGAALRRDVASALREVIATGVWQSDFHVRSVAAQWREEPRFPVFLERGLERRRNRGPKYEHLDVALLTFPETRAVLWRVYAAECPQHCRTDGRTFAEDRHVDDYREALFGWYAAIQHAHACVVRAARWFASADPAASGRPESFTDWIAGARRRGGSPVRDSVPVTPRPLQEIILMMHAWSPHTFEAIEVAFQKAEGEDASHSWGGGFEPAGRLEAQQAAEALASVLSPQERQQVRDVVAGIEADDEFRGMDLAKDNRTTCSSDLHRTYSAAPGGAEDCAKARGRVYAEVSRPWNEGPENHGEAARLARFLLGPRAERIRVALAAARAAVARDATEMAPQVWHDNAERLREAREAAELDLRDAAGHLGIKPATLQRFEQATGKLPGRPVSLGYLQLITLACHQAGRTAPAGIPQAISQPVTSLPTTL